MENTDKVYVHPSAQVWVAKLTGDGQIWEYDTESDANTKMTELDNADSTHRRYKVVQV